MFIVQLVNRNIGDKYLLKPKTVHAAIVKANEKHIDPWRVIDFVTAL